MATIVRHNIKNKLYILVGVGFGSSARVPPSAMFPTASSMSQDTELVAVTDASGEISFHPAFELSVIQVDGKSCSDLLGELQ